MYQIAKTWKFHAGHRLQGLPVGHKCSRLHGHTYSIELCLGGTALDDSGMVMDYAEMEELVKPFLTKWDHRILLRQDDPAVNVLRRGGEEESLVVLADNPTAETMARMVFDGASFMLTQKLGGGYDPNAPIKVLWVEVKESPTSMARVGVGG